MDANELNHMPPGAKQVNDLVLEQSAYSQVKRTRHATCTIRHGEKAVVSNLKSNVY